MSKRNRTKFAIIPSRVSDDSLLVDAIRPLDAAASLNIRMVTSIDPFKWAAMMDEIGLVVDRYARMTQCQTPRVRSVK